MSRSSNKSALSNLMAARVALGLEEKSCFNCRYLEPIINGKRANGACKHPAMVQDWLDNGKQMGNGAPCAGDRRGRVMWGFLLWEAGEKREE